ncbi:MAG: branched-chain amino acid ABC transporter permease [Candidatus Nanopelagicaceae bacterium]
MNKSVKRSSALTYFTIPIFTVLLIGLYLLPGKFDFSFQIKFVDLFVLIVIATMWNLLAGFGGLVSVGQQAFIGIGAYSLVFFSDLQGQSIIVSMVCAVIFAGIIAYALSFIVFRLKGGYFAIGTWVLAEIIKLVLVQIQSLGGGAGISLGAFAEIGRADRIKMVYFLALAVTVAVLLGTFLLMRSRLGLALTAIRDDSTAAGTLGVNVTLAQRTVFVIVAMGFAAAGSLIALTNLRVQPDDIFSVNYSAIMIFIVVVGGLGTIEGPILGAILFFFIQERLRDYGSIYLIILGIVAILSVLLAPRGLWGLLTRDKVSLFPTRYFISNKREG